MTKGGLASTIAIVGRFRHEILATPDDQSLSLHGHRAPRRPMDPTGLLALTLGAAVVGVLSGALTAGFRLMLETLNRLRDSVVGWSHGHSLLGFVTLVAGTAVAAGAAAWLVRRFSPHAGGSGIPHVEAVLEGRLPPAPFRLLWVKFVGGCLAMGAGLALGREGPSVQMGASIGTLLGGWTRRSTDDVRAWLAAGAGAGLATAFNAPLAGGIFVLEELVRRFDPRTAIAALTASATAIATARVFLGSAPDFSVNADVTLPPGSALVFALLGVVAGAVAVVYQTLTVRLLTGMDQLQRWPVERRAMGIGAMVGAVAWIAPG